MDDLVIALVVLLILIALLAAWRFIGVRSEGTPVVVRQMPATGPHGWRHGRIRYRGECAHYFKLRSLSPMSDSVFNHMDLHILGRRPLTEREAAFLPSHLHILSVVDGCDRQWEIALDNRAEMAFTAWLEAAPDSRQERPDLQKLQARVSHNRNRRVVPGQVPRGWRR